MSEGVREAGVESEVKRWRARRKKKESNVRQKKKDAQQKRISAQQKKKRAKQKEKRRATEEGRRVAEEKRRPTKRKGRIRAGSAAEDQKAKGQFIELACVPWFLMPLALELKMRCDR